MNPLVRKQLQVVEQNLRRLESAVSRAREEAARIEQERERLVQEQWRQRREIVTLQHARDDYDRLAEECEQLRGLQKELRERLQRVLGKTKALGEELRQ
jgi:hypothetical protein